MRPSFHSLLTLSLLAELLYSPLALAESHASGETASRQEDSRESKAASQEEWDELDKLDYSKIDSESLSHLGREKLDAMKEELEEKLTDEKNQDEEEQKKELDRLSKIVRIMASAKPLNSEGDGGIFSFGGDSSKATGRVESPRSKIPSFDTMGPAQTSGGLAMTPVSSSSTTTFPESAMKSVSSRPATPLSSMAPPPAQASKSSSSATPTNSSYSVMPAPSKIETFSSDFWNSPSSSTENSNTATSGRRPVAETSPASASAPVLASGVSPPPPPSTTALAVLSGSFWENPKSPQQSSFSESIRQVASNIPQVSFQVEDTLSVSPVSSRPVAEDSLSRQRGVYSRPVESTASDETIEKLATTPQPVFTDRAKAQTQIAPGATSLSLLRRQTAAAEAANPPPPPVPKSDLAKFAGLIAGD